METAVNTSSNLGSNLTINSVPSSLMLGVGYELRGNEAKVAGTQSAAATPIAAPVAKHCTFALHPVIIPPPNNKVSYLSKSRLQANTRSPSATNVTAAAVAAVAAASITPTCSAPALIEEDDDLQANTATILRECVKYPLDQRQSIQSQMTTIDDDLESDNSQT